MLAGPIDVAMPTWDSARYLDASLRSIRADRTFPVGRIFVIDRASTDGTQDIARRHGAEVLTDTVSLGSARQLGFDRARTEWMALIDSDVELYDGWFADVARYATLPDAGALQPTPVLPWMRKPRVLEDYRRRVFLQGEPQRLPAGGRGYTYCTILRRDLLTGVPLGKYEAYEDKAISDAVQAKGAAWWVVPVFPLHHVTLRENAKKARWNAAGRRDAGVFRPGREAMSTLGGLKDGVVDAVKFRDARFAANAALIAANSWLGYARPGRYRARHP